MNKLPCSVVEDLLPLYIDELCREETKALVAEHLENCPVCRSKWEAMHGPIGMEEADPRPTELEDENARIMLKKAATRYQGVAAGAVLLVLIVCLTMFFVMGGPAWLSEEINIPAREIELINVHTEEDGTVRLLIGADSYHAVTGGGMLLRTDESGQTYYIVVFWARRYSWLSPRMDGQDYAYTFDSKEETAGVSNLKPGDRVYAYDGSDMILLWDGTTS